MEAVRGTESRNPAASGFSSQGMEWTDDTSMPYEGWNSHRKQTFWAFWGQLGVLIILDLAG